MSKRKTNSWEASKSAIRCTVETHKRFKYWAANTGDFANHNEALVFMLDMMEYVESGDWSGLEVMRDTHKKQVVEFVRYPQHD